MKEILKKIWSIIKPWPWFYMLLFLFSGYLLIEYSIIAVACYIMLNTCVYDDAFHDTELISEYLSFSTSYAIPLLGFTIFFLIKIIKNFKTIYKK